MRPLKKILIRAAMALACVMSWSAGAQPAAPNLVQAASLGQTQAVAVMLQKGADPDARLANGRTALMEAAIGGYYETVRTLVIHGADKALKDRSGRTAYDLAFEKKHSDVIALLRDAS